MSTLPPFSEADVLAEQRRWQGVTSYLGQQFATSRDALHRLQNETVESSHVVGEAFAVRNLQIVAIEALDFLREHWRVSIAASQGLTLPVPEYRVGRWREVLDVSHPARPYNPFLGTPASLRAELQQTKQTLMDHGTFAGSVNLDDSRPLHEHYARLAERADREGASRVCGHETLGILRAVSDLAAVAASAPNSSPTLRSIADDLSDHVRKIERAFVASLKPHLRVPPNEDTDRFVHDTARDYQNIGLLRANLRKQLSPEKTPAGENDFLHHVSAEWTAYHLGIKPIAWFETLLRLSKEDIQAVHDTVSQAKREIIRSTPLYSETAAQVTLETAIEPLLRHLDTARQHARFLDRHREVLLKAGHATTAAALTYAFGLLPLGLYALGESAIYTKHVAPVVQELKRLATSTVTGSVVKDALKDIGDATREAPKSVFAGRIDKLVEGWRDLFFNHARARAAGPAKDVLAEQKRSLQSVFGQAAEHLGLASWRTVQRSRSEFIKQNAATLLELIEFSRVATNTLATMRRANRAYQEYDAAKRVPDANAVPAAFLHSEHYFITHAQETLKVLAAQATREQRLQQLSGASALTAPREHRYWVQRYSLLYQLARSCFTDAQNRQTGTTGNRPLALQQVRYDPSLLDSHLWKMVGSEDRAAANSSSDRRCRNDIHIGRRFHYGLPPTSHFSTSLARQLFGIPELPTALAILKLSREPGVAKTIEEHLRSQIGPGPAVPIPVVANSPDLIPS